MIVSKFVWGYFADRGNGWRMFFYTDTGSISYYSGYGSIHSITTETPVHTLPKALETLLKLRGLYNA